MLHVTYNRIIFLVKYDLFVTSFLEKLSIQFNDLKEAIECLMWVLVECTKLNVSEI